MTKSIRYTIIFAMGLLSLCLGISPIHAAVIAPSDTVEAVTASVDSARFEESLLPDRGLNLALSHFTWGAEIGSSVDLTAHDMSTFDLDVLLGYKNAYIKLAGIGAGIHRSIHTGNNFIPVYAVIRTSFRKRPSLLFMDLQAGYSFNTISDSKVFGDYTCSLGLGFNLKQNSRWKSHIIIAAGYRHFNGQHRNDTGLDIENVFLARLLLGVNF